MEYSCFTLLCHFLLYSKLNQPYILLFLDFPSSQVITEHQVEFPVIYSRFSLVIYFIHCSVYMSIPISQFIHFFPFPLGIHVYSLLSVQFSSVESRLFATPWTAALQASLCITISWSLLKLRSIESVMPSKHFILCYSLLLPSVFSSNSIFSSESALLIRWPKYWSFSFIICPSNEFSGLTSFRIDWFDLLAVQGMLESLLQHHSLKVLVLQCSVYCSTLTSVHYYWKDHSFDYMDLCRQSDVSAF